MVENGVDAIADRLAGTGPPPQGTFLFLGAADTGKTTLMAALAERLARHQPVTLVDADIGQSHIGPPTTVGWTVLEEKSRPAVLDEAPIAGVSREATRGIAFVGDITPVGHLLQLIAALSLCIEQAKQAAKVVLVDTPGLVTGGAACSLWWTVQRLLRPERIIALQRQEELRDLLGGLQAGLSRVEVIPAPPALRRKSPEARQQYRHTLFRRYFQSATTCTLDLQHLAVRAMLRLVPDRVTGHIAGLTDTAGQDLAIGVINRWQREKGVVTMLAPPLDAARVQCLTIGNAKVDIPFGWS
jgi:polynucleotide 5'-hydroxyl-kinase GRC3/NOL9